MAINHQVLATAAALAGPLALAVIYVIQHRNNPQVSQKLAADSVARDARLGRDYTSFRSGRWYDYLATLAFVIMPFVQWFAYLQYRNASAVLIPLITVCTLLLLIQIMSPKGVWRNRPKATKQIKTFFVLAALLLLSFISPATGVVLICRGILIDGIALFVTNAGAHYAQSRRAIQAEGLG
ncbi:MAG: hypothetical protein ABIQ43_07440 [Sphingomonas sp.]